MKKVFDTHVHLTEKHSLLESMDAYDHIFEYNGVERVIFHCLLIDKNTPDADLLENLKGLFLKKHYAPNAYCFAAFAHDNTLTPARRAEDLLAQAHEYMAAGYDGIKMLEGKPNRRTLFPYLLSDESYDPFYNFMEENGFPITLHNADPITFWDKSQMTEHEIQRGWFVDETQLTHQQMFEDVLAVMKKHPHLHLTLAHFGFTSTRMDNAEHFLGDYPYTMFDTTPGGSELLNRRATWNQWLPFFEKYQDRIKFGTDTYNIYGTYDDQWKRNVSHRPGFLRDFFETDTEHEYDGTTYTGVKLDEQLLQKIYTENAIREYGMPREIDFAYLQKKVDESLRALGSNPIYAEDLATMKKILTES